MNTENLEAVVAIVSPFARDKEALKAVTRESSFLRDLKVNSSRLVDIVLALEDRFNIEIADEEADKIETVGAALDLIQSKQN